MLSPLWPRSLSWRTHDGVPLAAIREKGMNDCTPVWGFLIWWFGWTPVMLFVGYWIGYIGGKRDAIRGKGK
jgi:hypothetical protein